MVDKEKVVRILTQLLGEKVIDCKTVLDFIKNDLLTQKDIIQKINELFDSKTIKDVDDVFLLIMYVASGESLCEEKKSTSAPLNGENFVLNQKPFEFGKPVDYPWNQQIYCTTSTSEK